MTTDTGPIESGGQDGNQEAEQAGEVDSGRQGDIRDDAQRQSSSTASSPEQVAADKAQAAKDAEQANAWLQNKRIIKVNGVEREVTAEEAFSKYSLPASAFEKMEQANKIRKESDAKIKQFEQLVLQNPEVFLERLLGAEKARAVHERYVTKHLEWDMLPEQEKQRRQFEQERRQFEQERQKYEHERREAQQAAYAKQLQEDYARSFPEALKKRGMETSPEFIREMAAVAQNMVKARLQWTPDDVARIVEENERERETRYSASRKKRYESMQDDAALYNAFVSEHGEDVLNRFRRADVARLGAKQTTQQPAQAAQKPTQQSTNKYTSIDQLREELERMRSGG